jgi:hypothetical protein
MLTAFPGLLLQIWLAVTGSELMNKLQVLIFPLLLLYLAHFLLLHAVDYFQFFALLDALLVFIALLHEFLHVTIDVLIDCVQLS